MAWIAERKNVLSRIFWHVDVVGLCEYARQTLARALCAVPVCYGLGLMSKKMLVTLPFALLLLDCWPLEGISITQAAGG